MNLTKPTDFLLNLAALPISHPTLNDSFNPDNELVISLEDWSMDLLGDGLDGLDFSGEVPSILAGDHSSPELIIIQEDTSSQRDHAYSVSNQQGKTKPHLGPDHSLTDQEDGAFTDQKQKDNWSVPGGREKMTQNEYAGSTHAQTQCSLSDLSQADFGYFENGWKVENAGLVDIDQFFQAGGSDSILPKVSNDAAILQSVLQSDYAMPPLTKHPHVLGGQRLLRGSRMQPLARPINPPITRMKQRSLLGNRTRPPARSVNPSQTKVRQWPFIKNKMPPPLSYVNVMQLPANQMLTRTLRQTYGTQSLRSAKLSLVKMRPPIFGVIEPVKGTIRPMKWEWRQLPEKTYGVLRSTRWDKIKHFNPKIFYSPILKTPQSFGRHEPGDLPPFRYNRFGELLTKKKFSPTQIYDYLANHPLHHSTSGYDPKNSKLILWIQNIPSDSSNRYPNNLSDKCRFSDCPAPNHTIFKGFFRVAFDEQSAECPFVDPFHCAGFVHLYCLEKFCDFPSICRIFNVQPDVRELPEGANKMSIIRDYDEMEEVVDNFIASAAGKPKARKYEESLGYLLTMEILKLEPKVRKVRRRESCSGNTIGDHLGNLIKWVDAGGVNGYGVPSYQDNERATNKRCHSVSVDENYGESANAKKQRLEIERDIQEPRWKVVKVPKRKWGANSELRLELEELRVERRVNRMLLTTKNARPLML